MALLVESLQQPSLGGAQCQARAEAINGCSHEPRLQPPALIAAALAAGRAVVAHLESAGANVAAGDVEAPNGVRAAVRLAVVVDEGAGCRV